MVKMLNATEVAERMRITPAHLRQMHFRGDAPPRIQVSPRHYIYDEDRLEAWMRSRELVGSTREAA